MVTQAFDRQGTPVRWSEGISSFCPFGWVRMPGSAPRGRGGFNGQWCEGKQGYVLGNGYRMYLPSLMRFIGPDSASPFTRRLLNAYGYCYADPVNNTDPTGHISLAKLMTLSDFLVETKVVTRHIEARLASVQDGLLRTVKGRGIIEQRMAEFRFRHPTKPMDRNLQFHYDRALAYYKKQNDLEIYLSGRMDVLQVSMFRTEEKLKYAFRKSADPASAFADHALYVESNVETSISMLRAQGKYLF